jgi:predicted lipid-binding transport protein (Tim44 family)
LEKIYTYFDLILVILLFLFLFFKFKSLLGKKVGLQSYKVKEEIIETLKNKQLNIELFEVDEKFKADISKIKELNPSFTYDKFLLNSKKAFELIVYSFNDNDLSNIKHLITEEVYNLFNQAIIKRDNKKLEILIKDFNNVEISKIQIINNEIYIDVTFNTKQLRKINTTEKEYSLEEIWTFKNNPNKDKIIWKLSSIKVN